MLVAILVVALLLLAGDRIAKAIAFALGFGLHVVLILVMVCHQSLRSVIG